jgi:NAD(P)H-flavin reductase
MVAKKYPTIRYIQVLEEGKAHYNGYITATIIKEVVGDSSNKTFFVCGPQVYINISSTNYKPYN